MPVDDPRGKALGTEREAQSTGGGFRLGPRASGRRREPAGWRGPRAALAPQVVGNCRKLGAPKVFFIAADMASREVPELVVQFALDKLGEGRGLGLDLGAGPELAWGVWQ